MSLRNVGGILRAARSDDGYNSKEWLRFSAFIRRQRGNTCECCRLGRRKTQVHHLYYDWSRKLWEYPPEDVILLCESCHAEIHAELSKFRKHVFKHLNGQAFRVLNGALAVGLDNNEPITFVHALAEFVSTPGLVDRYAAAWSKSENQQLSKAL